MTRISPKHPRYASLRSRATLANAARRGLVVPEGLIAHGRAEAFDYFLGERTIPSARRAERRAAEWLAAASHPVISVNGNVAALAAREVAALVQADPRIQVEVNLFHRSRPRVRLVRSALRRAGVLSVLGIRPTRRIAEIASERARVDPRGLWIADVCLIPLEDGDRAMALRRSGRRVISIDLNPLSRTSEAAHIPIVDDLGRALRNIAHDLGKVPRGRRGRRFLPFDARRARRDALRAMINRLPK